MMAIRGLRLALMVALAMIATGCAHIGPQTVALDRFDYSSAIADSWKQQTLLNIVKLRYLDLPVFVEVASIVSGYSLQTGVNVGGTVSGPNAIQGDFLAAGAHAIYTDRPTITYLPMTGERFLRGMVTPIDPKAIFSMLQSGYAADFILALTVESLNGVRNRSAIGMGVREGDPAFFQAMEMLREVQMAGGVGMRVEEDKDKGKTGVLLLRNTDLPPELQAKSAEVRRLLQMPADGQTFTLKFSPLRGGDGELSVNSRSMLQIMGAFASYIDVPQEHVQDGRAISGPVAAAGSEARKTVRIHSGREKPAAAFAAVYYRDHWFWIDDRDVHTKRAITAIMFFFTLADSGSPDRAPLITIPAQ